jgi:predicted RNase H-like HicB family nuclease
MRYPVVIEPGDETTAFGVVVPDLPGCFSAGDTLDEAISNAQEAAAAWIDAVLDAGGAIPAPSRLDAIRASHSFSAMSQLLSYYYESVTFYWANRASDYGNCADAIKRAHADIVIEESSERFLLSNFRVSASASTLAARS